MIKSYIVKKYTKKLHNYENVTDNDTSCNEAESVLNWISVMGVAKKTYEPGYLDDVLEADTGCNSARLRSAYLYFYRKKRFLLKSKGKVHT